MTLILRDYKLNSTSFCFAAQASITLQWQTLINAGLSFYQSVDLTVAGTVTSATQAFHS